MIEYDDKWEVCEFQENWNEDAFEYTIQNSAGIEHTLIDVPLSSYESSCSQYYDDNEIDSQPWGNVDISACYADLDSVNYVFVNKELPTLIRNKLRRRHNRKNFLDHYLYFCSTIFYLSKVDKRYAKNEFVPINAMTMASVIGSYKYKQIKENLILWGIIEVSNRYIVGNQSKGFRLAPRYDQNIKKRKIKDKRINAKLNVHKSRKVDDVENLILPYQYLAWTNLRVELDCQSATVYNQKYYSTQSTNQYDANYFSIEAYKDKAYRFSVDEFGRRAHSNLTNLKSDFRRFLSAEGEPLGQVDISNAQPLFFYLHIKNIDKIPDSEKENYKHLVESGKFYEFFLSNLEISLEQRNDLKPKILTALFFDRMRNEESRYLKVFRKEFPSISQFIIECRSEDHTQLARVLQRAESNFIIEKVVNKFIAYYGSQQEFISTIHDSVVVKVSRLAMAKRVMNECFLAKGVKAKLSTTNFSEKCTKKTPKET